MRETTLGATFGRDSAMHFLPGTLAFMVFLAALALAGAMLAADASRHWAIAASGTLTVELPPAVASESAQDEIERVAQALRTVTGVRTVEPLSANKTRALIEPWLGRGAAIPDLPLPRLIDVRIEPGAQVPSSMLAERASAVVPGATVDDHASWAGPVITLVNAIKTLALAVAGVTGATAIGTTIFVTRMRLDIHRDVVELLHIMGARNATIAHQFAAHAGRLALMGGIMGVLPAIFILFGLGQAAGQIEAVLVPQFSFSLWQWFAIIALPVVAALLAMLTAQITTLAALRRMP